MAYREKDTKKWSAQWFETTAKGEKKKRRKRGFETKREALEYERQKKLNSSRSMDMKLSEITASQIIQWQNEMQTKGLPGGSTDAVGTMINVGRGGCYVLYFMMENRRQE